MAGGTECTFFWEARQVLLPPFKDSSDFLEMCPLLSLALGRMGRTGFFLPVFQKDMGELWLVDRRQKSLLLGLL